MIPLGDILLYASLAVSVIALVGLLLKDLKNIEFLNRFAAPAIMLVAGFLTFAYLLLTYYFVTGNFAYDYVWQRTRQAVGAFYLADPGNGYSSGRRLGHTLCLAGAGSGHGILLRPLRLSRSLHLQVSYMRQFMLSGTLPREPFS